LYWVVWFRIEFVYAFNVVVCEEWKGRHNKSTTSADSLLIAGILYGIVVTLPSLVMKYELACECQTEECTGSSTMCSINRLGIYLLLSILINLCVITYQLMKAVIGGLRYRSSIKKTLNLVSVVLPLLIAAIGYALQVEANEGENAKLNTVRHAFTCSMRFRDMKTEWLAIWI
jgi:hypothetical protein